MQRTLQTLLPFNRIKTSLPSLNTDPPPPALQTSPEPWGSAGFLLMILWCSQSVDHAENNLAKFGYILDIKVEEKQDPSIFFAT
jgi:hypothetical protein